MGTGMHENIGTQAPETGPHVRYPEPPKTSPRKYDIFKNFPEDTVQTSSSQQKESKTFNLYALSEKDLEDPRIQRIIKQMHGKGKWEWMSKDTYKAKKRHANLPDPQKIPQDITNIPVGTGGLAQTGEGVFKPNPDQSVPAKEVISCVIDNLPTALEETEKKQKIKTNKTNEVGGALKSVKEEYKDEKANDNNLPAQSSSTVQEQPPPINMNTLAYGNISVSKNPAVKRSLLSDLPKNTEEHIDKIKNPALEKKVKEKDKQTSSEIRWLKYEQKQKHKQEQEQEQEQQNKKTEGSGAGNSLQSMGIEIKNGEVYNSWTGKKIKKTPRGFYIVVGQNNKWRGYRAEEIEKYF